ncbi:hypothetical protein PVAP13_4KG236520 [Panicum virgatum]|uniref:Uncharacterized protein n=1 Tax=Panicum virgatum TaxID=38727 RepID=A0A8T0TJI3_PANVG|nr:hypothetical protein PVAP13_4KG236520 [Panicum virgatum]
MPLQNWRWSTASPLTPPSSPLFCKQVSGPVYRSCCHHCRLFRSRIVFIPYHHFPLNVRPVRRWGAPIASNYSEPVVSRYGSDDGLLEHREALLEKVCRENKLIPSHQLWSLLVQIRFL